LYREPSYKNKALEAVKNFLPQALNRKESTMSDREEADKKKPAENNGRRSCLSPFNAAQAWPASPMLPPM